MSERKKRTISVETIEGEATLGALLQRINRQLREDGQVLRTTRGERGRGDVGDYYCTEGNRLVAQHVDPEEWGRELGVLAPHESVEWDGLVIPKPSQEETR